MTTAESNFLEMLRESKKVNTYEEVEKLFESCSDMINNFARPDNEVIEKIGQEAFLKKQMDQISWYWIRAAAVNANKKYMYDERNRRAFKTCHELLETLSGGKIIVSNTEEFVEDDFMNLGPKSHFTSYNTGYLFSWFMMKEHRTLQQ